MSGTDNEGALGLLLANLPDTVVDSLTPEQRAALWSASKPLSWRRHPVNIRLTFSFFGRRHFVTIVAGSERRGPDRIKRERKVHPLHTVGNVLFMLGLAGVFYLLAVFGIFLLSNLIEL